MEYQLAQFNIAQGKGPTGSEIMTEFREGIGRMNELAESSAGFIWRLKDEAGNSSTYLEAPIEGENMLVNMSVWKDVKSLKDFTYKTAHSFFIKNKALWFDKMPKMHMVLWWIPEGHIPTLTEGKEKLELLQENGPSIEAFLFSKPFDPPDR